MPRKNKRVGYKGRGDIRLSRLVCGPMSPETRKAIFGLCAGRCAYCGKKLDFKRFTIDHVRPLSMGGEDDIGNMLPACRRCNEEKRDMPLDEFREVRGGNLFFEMRRRSDGGV